MRATWFGDHRLVSHLKQQFESEVAKLGLEPGNFVVTISRLPDAAGLDAVRYMVNVENVVTRTRATIQGGGGRDWIADFISRCTRARNAGPLTDGSAARCKVCGVPLRSEGRCDNGVCLACHADYCDMREHTIDVDGARTLHVARTLAMFRESIPGGSSKPPS